MKDIDFLPEWYRSGRRRQVAYRTQYIALVGVMVVMAVWNFATGHSVSRAEAEVAQMAAEQTQVEGASQEFMNLQDEIRQIQKKANTLEMIDSRVDVAAVLGELSYLIDERVVLGKVDLISEQFADDGKDKQQPARSGLVRAASGKGNAASSGFVGEVRFKVIISGVAASSGDVMLLVSRLEESTYFFHVELSFSRDSVLRIGGSTDKMSNMQMKKASNSGAIEPDKSIKVNDFEIRCYLANYLEK